MEIRRFDVYIVSLDPTLGHEIQKSRPCVVLSPDEMYRSIQTVIVAPMTTVQRSYPTRTACEFQGRSGAVVLDQIRAVDKTRLTRKLGHLSPQYRTRILSVLREMFAE